MLRLKDGATQRIFRSRIYASIKYLVGTQGKDKLGLRRDGQTIPKRRLSSPPSIWSQLSSQITLHEPPGQLGTAILLCLGADAYYECYNCIGAEIWKHISSGFLSLFQMLISQQPRLCQIGTVFGATCLIWNFRYGWSLSCYTRCRGQGRYGGKRPTPFDPVLFRVWGPLTGCGKRLMASNNSHEITREAGRRIKYMKRLKKCWLLW